MTPTRSCSHERHRLTGRHAGLDFSLLLPLGWQLDASESAAPAAASAWVELARSRSPAAAGAEPARVVVSGCSRAEAGSLECAMGALLRRQGLSASASVLHSLRLGRHEGLTATLQVRHRGRALTLRVAVLEDGARLLRVVLAVPSSQAAQFAQIWATLTGGLLLEDARGATLPLHLPGTDWWVRAQAAESAGQLDVAENIVRRQLPSASCAVQTARLYVQRARRLSAAGDREGARQARDLAQGWTSLHAGFETIETRAAAR